MHVLSVLHDRVKYDEETHMTAVFGKRRVVAGVAVILAVGAAVVLSAFVSGYSGWKEGKPMDDPATDLGMAHLRVACPTDDLDALVRFYRDGLGFSVIYEFKGHNGF